VKRPDRKSAPNRARLWAPPVLGIPAMLILSELFVPARYLLFNHHLFWFFGVILLINPVTESFWPGPDRRQGKRFRGRRPVRARSKLGRAWFR